MTYAEAMLREQVLGQTMGRPLTGGEKIVVNRATREQYRLERGKQRHEPLWLDVDTRTPHGAKIRTVQVEVVA